MRKAWLVVALAAGCSVPRSGTGGDELPVEDTAVDTLVFDGPLETASDEGVVVDADDATTDADAVVADASDAADADDAGADADADAGDADAGCRVPLPTTKLCDEIPKLPPGVTPVLDGKPDELCHVPVFEYDNTTGDYRDPSPTPAGAATKMRVRVAWNETGLFFHFSVDDPKLLVEAGKDAWRGDSVEVYAAGFQPTAGTFNKSSDVGARQYVIAPTGGGVTQHAEIFLTGSHDSALSSTYWQTRSIPGGYEVELHLPWSYIAPSKPTPTTGTKIGLDFGLNNKWEPSTKHAFSLWRVLPVSGSPSCGGGSGLAYCDDRTWCTPRLVDP